MPGTRRCLSVLGQRSAISWKDGHTPGWSCRKLPLLLEVASASVTNPVVTREIFPQPDAFGIFHVISCCLSLSPSPPAILGFPQGSGELFLCRSKPQEHSPVSLPLKLQHGRSTRTFGKGGGQARPLLFLRKVFSQLFCSPGPHLPSSACLGSNFPLSHASKKTRDICVCHQFGLTPT